MKKILQSAVPLIHQVILIIDSITAHFDSVIDDITINLAVRHAALQGIIILNKYYLQTDDSIVYCIATSKLFLSRVDMMLIIHHQSFTLA